MGDKEKATMCSCCLCRYLFHLNKDVNHLSNSGIFKNLRHEVHEHQRISHIFQHGERSSRSYLHNRPSSSHSSHFHQPANPVNTRGSERSVSTVHPRMQAEPQVQTGYHAPARAPTGFIAPPRSQTGFFKHQAQPGLHMHYRTPYENRTPLHPATSMPVQPECTTQAETSAYRKNFTHPGTSEEFLDTEKRRRVSRWDGSSSKLILPSNSIPAPNSQVYNELLDTSPKNSNIKNKSSSAPPSSSSSSDSSDTSLSLPSSPEPSKKTKKEAISQAERLKNLKKNFEPRVEAVKLEYRQCLMPKKKTLEKGDEVEEEAAAGPCIRKSTRPIMKASKKENIDPMKKI